MSQIATPFSRALSDVQRAVDYLTPNNRRGGSSFRAIARSFPAMLQSEGLIVSISFLYSKAKDEWKDRTILEKGAGLTADDPKKLNATYLKLISEYLNSMLSLEEEPLKMIRELVNDREKVRISESLLAPYVSELKMLSEAVFEEEGSGA